MDLERHSGSDNTYISSLPSKIGFLYGSGWLSGKIRALGTHLMSPLKPTPQVVSSSAAWSVKNTAIAAQQLMLAATSLGVSSAPMEGFDELRLCFELGIPPEDYTVPLVVSLGYSHSADEAEQTGGRPDAETQPQSDQGPSSTHRNAIRPKLRFRMEDVCFSDKYGRPFLLRPEESK